MIKVKANILYVLLFGIFFFEATSCERKITPDFKYDGKEFLIVDGIITNENKFQEIRLTKSLSVFNEKPEPISGAKVSVSDGIYNYIFSEDTTGIYLSDNKFTAVINKLYTLNIEFEGKTFFAQARAVPVLNSISINYAQFNDSLYYFPQATAQFNPKEAAMYEVNADWSFVSGYENLPENKTKAKLYFYVLRTIDVNEIFNPAYDHIFFPKGTKLAVKKYSLSLEHEKFIRSMLLETSWNGGNFDTEEDNVYTNLSEGALGFFGASIVLSDTVYVN